MTEEDWQDDDHWVDLAKQFKVRLPQRATSLTTGAMERWLRKLGMTGAMYREWTGNQSFKQFIADNEHWSLRAFVGICMEHLEWLKTQPTVVETAPTTRRSKSNPPLVPV